MPLAVKDISWEQTEDALTIVIPLNGVKAAKVDIYSNDVFIKVGLIDCSRHSCTRSLSPRTSAKSIYCIRLMTAPAQQLWVKVW